VAPCWGDERLQATDAGRPAGFTTGPVDGAADATTTDDRLDPVGARRPRLGRICQNSGTRSPVTDRADDDRSAVPGVPSSFRGEEPGQVAQHERTAGPTRPADPASGTGAMPDPDAPHEEPNLSYIPALDGMRAFAVLGVMAFHGGIPWLVGGYLGVDAFFVLSGFLITSLLVNEWHRLRTIRLGAFWARRARRLLPALLLVLLFVACYAAFIVPRGTYPNLRLDSLSTLFYVANWHFILIGSSYFNQTGLPSPLTHTW
jgi:hypothetical protein